MSKVWFITGTGRGIGLEIAKAALAAGDNVVATGRDPASIRKLLGGESEYLLVARHDVTVSEQADQAVDAAIRKFGRIDVLVNNAGYGQLGLFEESSPAEMELQFKVNVFGSMATTRAVLPVMRKQRAGRVFTITSIGGLIGAAGSSLYSGTKFALEGWSESVAAEVAAFGIRVTAVEPGFFRTDFLDSASVRFAKGAIPDYAEHSKSLREFFEGRSHQQAGDPAKLAKVFLQLTDEVNPPLHFLAGTDAVGVLQERIKRDEKQLATWGRLSRTTDHD